MTVWASGGAANTIPCQTLRISNRWQIFQNEKIEIIFDGILVPTDPRLGVEGRPQSASGQTTILTGINAPQFLGVHKQGFPNQKLRDVIAEYSIFLQLRNLNIEPNIFVNAYTPKILHGNAALENRRRRARSEAANGTFRKLPDLYGRKALFHDFTNRHLIELGFESPVFSPTEAAEILAELTANHRFTLYEYFITDKIGHAQDFGQSRRISTAARRIYQSRRWVKFNLEKTTFILTSDHGNIEDLSVRNHTLNDVPTIIWGRNNITAAARIKDLSDITPTILDLLI